MKFNFMSVEKHNAAVAAKDARIAELEAELKGEGKSANAEATVKKLTGIFGADAEKEDFDLVAKVEETVTYATKIEEDLTTATTSLETANASLATANGRLDAAAKVLGKTSAKDVDLAAAIAAIEPEERTNPLDTKDKKVTKDEDPTILCSVDAELKAMLKNAQIN